MGDLPVQAYVQALADDLRHDAHWAQGRKISSIFFGGGTPSLMPNQAIGEILTQVEQTIGIEKEAEITLEANPGTLEYHNFRELKKTGVNRLSLGVQSFNPRHLNQLGRIHNGDEARDAVKRAQDDGFDNINLDLMHGLPGQSIAEALQDLEHACALTPQHLSWYQLTIEQNTEFFSRPPSLPCEDVLADIFEQGQYFLSQHGFSQYEISAYSTSGCISRHNLNYWQFGDYLAIGAGAHGKITLPQQHTILRYQKTRLPQDYLNPNKAFTARSEPIDPANLGMEFMMNALRLNQGVSKHLFSQRTGQPLDLLHKNLSILRDRGLLEDHPDQLLVTNLGRRFLNTVLEQFLAAP